VAEVRDAIGSPAYDGWPAEARAAVERSIAAHGGWAAWQALDVLRLRFATASGPLLTLKGYPYTFAAPRDVETRPHERVTIFHSFPDPLHRGRFGDGDVAIERLDGGTVHLSRDHRATFSGMAKYRRWRPLDALYFFGYALWHYHVLPFTLGAARFVAARDEPGGGASVVVEFPPGVHTHCPRQRFFFDEQGRIVRNDYVADVLGSWARGCHLWEDYHRVSGVLVARRHRVVARAFGHATPIPVLLVTLQS
jgi:hypothetical protein